MNNFESNFIKKVISVRSMSKEMEVEIHDTYVKNKKGDQMHFDVAVEKGKGNEYAVESAKKWLESIGEKDAKITSEECSFCHVQGAEKDEVKEIQDKGYAIIKMANCP